MSTNDLATRILNGMVACAGWPGLSANRSYYALGRAGRAGRIVTIGPTAFVIVTALIDAPHHRLAMQAVMDLLPIVGTMGLRRIKNIFREALLEDLAAFGLDVKCTGESVWIDTPQAVAAEPSRVHAADIIDWHGRGIPVTIIAARFRLPYRHIAAIIAAQREARA